MESIDSILKDVPFFRHCTESEILFLKKCGRRVSIQKGHKLDLRKMGAFYIVFRGIFEIEALGKSEIIYLAPGSFFGDIPFTVNKQQGMVTALVDSELLVYDSEDVYKFFLISFKAMRGYLKTIGKMGFEMSDLGKKNAGNQSRIITVNSPYEKSGKSIFASCLGLACSEHAKTIILDMSYKGDSVFNIFEKKMTSAISQKHNEQVHTEQFIHERIEPVNENLSLMNVAYGSKVKVNPEIISPLLFILSKEFRYIVIDLSHSDESLRDRVYEITDLLFMLIKKIRDRELVYGILDEKLKEGQRVFYTINKFYDKEINLFEGGLIFDNLELNKKESLYPVLSRYVKSDNAKKLIEYIVNRQRAVICDASVMESVIFAGALNALNNSGMEINMYYSSSLSYLIIAMFLLSKNTDEFEKVLIKTFSEEKINDLLDISFPENHIIKNGRIYKFVKEIAKDKRIEIFKNLPAVMLVNEKNQSARLFSTGYFSDLLTASFLLYPVFESYKISGNSYHSGFPGRKARVEDLLRTDIGEAIFISIKNKKQLQFKGNRLLKFFIKYLEYLYIWQSQESFNEMAEKNILIEIEENEFKVKKILKLSEESINKWLKDKRN